MTTKSYLRSISIQSAHMYQLQDEKDRGTAVKNQKGFNLADIEDILADIGATYTVRGERSRTTFNGVADIKNASKDQLSFCSSAGAEAYSRISETNAGVVLCKRDLEAFMTLNKRESQQVLLFVDNPRLAFIHIMKRTCNVDNRKKVGVSPSAIISESSEICKNSYVGNFSIIGDNCYIGNNVIIHDRVNILENTKVGENCIIQPGTVIGADGFGFERNDATLELERFPHIGGVIIQDGVEISSNCSIARGCIDDTVLGHGTKLDALVHIAHNVKIGADSVITAGVIIGGSTIIGKTCWFGLNSTLKNKIKIGSRVIVGSGASVIHDIEDEDIVAGVPARSIKNKVTCDKLFMMAGLRR